MQVSAVTAAKRKPKKRTAAGMLRERDKLAKQILDEAKIDGKAAAKILADTVAELHIARREIFEEKIHGLGNAEETRTLPSLASNIKRICDALGATNPAEGDEDEL